MPNSAFHSPHQNLPARTRPAGRNLRRALWGVRPDAAEALVAERTADLQAQIRAAQSQVEREREQHRRLELEVDQLQRRADVLRRAVDLLRDALQRERSQAEAVRSALAEELAQMDRRHAARLQDLRFAQAHQEAELQRSSREVSDLIAALRRILAGDR